MLPAHFLSGFSVDVEAPDGLTAESHDNASVGQLALSFALELPASPAIKLWHPPQTATAIFRSLVLPPLCQDVTHDCCLYSQPLQLFCRLGWT